MDTRIMLVSWFLLLNIGCYSQRVSINSIFICYYPFSIETQISFDESSFQNLKNDENYIVKFDTIRDINIISEVAKQIEKLKIETSLGKKESYDLRMQCVLFYKGVQSDTFYFDRRSTIFKGRVYDNEDSLRRLILNNICRPYYTYYMIQERSFWHENTNCCFDTIYFKRIFGDDAYESYKNDFPNIPWPKFNDK